MTRRATRIPPSLVVAGVDEAGRGCLAGPVFAAAVILAEGRRPRGLDDSKRLSPEAREDLYGVIVQRALAWGVGRAEVEEIDRVNILQATFLAMRRAVTALAVTPAVCWVDGNQDPRLEVPVRTVIEGDAIEPCIMAASILAKVSRDRELRRLDTDYPAYGFARHKGYGTPEHLQALREHGPCVLHRQSFAPCRQLTLSLDAFLDETGDMVTLVDGIA
jgi:ribonuclease HII